MSGIGDIFGGIGSLFGSSGYGDAAAAYERAAHIAEQNQRLTGYATGIQLAQTERKIEQTIGAQEAGTGAANVAGGSAGDLMRSSVQQGALAKSIVQTQGAINQNAYAEQAQAYLASAAAAKAAQQSSLFGGIGGILGGIFSLF